MPYNRFVEIGRVALINYGPDQGKLCVILDVADKNTGLVQGPTTGVERQLMPLKRLSLTDIKIPVSRNAHTPTLVKVFTDAKVSEQWEKSSWGKKLALRAFKARMTDLDRFKAMLDKKKKKFAALVKPKGAKKVAAKK